MSATTFNQVHWDDIYNILLHIFSYLSLKEVKVARLVCQKWELAADFITKKKGRLHWTKFFQTINSITEESVARIASEERLSGYPSILICSFEDHKEHDVDTRRSSMVLESDFRIFAKYTKDNFISDAEICANFTDNGYYRAFEISPIFFLYRFMHEVNHGKFQNLATLSLTFRDMPNYWRREEPSRFLFKENSLLAVSKLTLGTRLCHPVEEEYVSALTNSLIAAAPNLAFLETDFPDLNLTNLVKLTQLHVNFAGRDMSSTSAEQLVTSLLSMLTDIESKIKKLSFNSIVFNSRFTLLPVFKNVEELSLEYVYLFKGNIAIIFPSLRRLSFATDCAQTCGVLREYITLRSLSSPLECLELRKTVFVEILRSLLTIALPAKKIIFWLRNDCDCIPSARTDDSLPLLAEIEHNNVIVKVWGDTRVSSLIKRLSNLQLKRTYFMDGKAIEFHFVTTTTEHAVCECESNCYQENDTEITKFKKVMKLLTSKWSKIKIKYFYVTQRQLDVMTEGIADMSLPVEIFCGIKENSSTTRKSIIRKAMKK